MFCFDRLVFAIAQTIKANSFEDKADMNVADAGLSKLHADGKSKGFRAPGTGFTARGIAHLKSDTLKTHSPIVAVQKLLASPDVETLRARLTAYTPRERVVVVDGAPAAGTTQQRRTERSKKRKEKDALVTDMELISERMLAALQAIRDYGFGLDGLVRYSDKGLAHVYKAVRDSIVTVLAMRGDVPDDPGHRRLTAMFVRLKLIRKDMDAIIDGLNRPRLVCPCARPRSNACAIAGYSLAYYTSWGADDGTADDVQI